MDKINAMYKTAKALSVWNMSLLHDSWTFSLVEFLLKIDRLILYFTDNIISFENLIKLFTTQWSQNEKQTALLDSDTQAAIDNSGP